MRSLHERFARPGLLLLALIVAQPVSSQDLGATRLTTRAVTVADAVPLPAHSGQRSPAVLEDSPSVPRAGAPQDLGCLESYHTSCLQDGRFRMKAFAIKPDGEQVKARVKDALIGDEASLFYFFEFDNVELLVKVLDGCGVNGRYWVFGSAATDLEYTVEIKDLANERSRQYGRNGANPLINDTNAFVCEVEAEYAESRGPSRADRKSPPPRAEIVPGEAARRV